MKISVSLPEEDVQFLDELGPNRSATLQHAITLMRRSFLHEQYTEAFSEWAESEDAALWETATGDGTSA